MNIIGDIRKELFKISLLSDYVIQWKHFNSHTILNYDPIVLIKRPESTWNCWLAKLIIPIFLHSWDIFTNTLSFAPAFISPVQDLI